MEGPTIWMMAGVFLLMWLLVMRPEQKRRKEQQALLSAVKVGDTVVTLGGMHGTISSLTDKTVTLRVDTVKMTFDRTAISRVVRDDAPATDAKKN
jgi:preprotein translocase subunit YajC